MRQPALCLSAEGVTIAYGTRTVLNIDRFDLFDGDRVGLVGENGAGKTTFMRILAGEIAPDGGAVRRLAPLSYIRQMDEKGAVEIARGREAGEFRALPDRDGLSGGEKTRRRIAAALSADARVLLADEPTSDLDREGVELLEKRLASFDGALLLVSHDRALLDRLCNRIAELEDGRLTVYPGNYSAYREEKERRRDFQRFEYDQYRGEQARLRAAIQGVREHASQVGKLPSRMGNSEARLHKRSTTEVEEKLNKTRKALSSRLNHMEEKERPREDPGIVMRLGAYTPVTSKTAVEVRGMTIRFPGRGALLENADMRLPTGSRTALLGPNGCGKTTLISRIVAGGDPRVRINPGVKIGWFGQDHQKTLDMDKSALENVLYTSVLPESDARTVLARLNLRGDDVFKKTGVLSGGERAKIALAKLFAADVNLLVLDEPTNHLDVFTLESLQEVLASYGGTLLFVSHDRRFVEAVATRLVFFEGVKLMPFEGDIALYASRKNNASRDAEDLRMAITAGEMRLAQLAARMAHPQKGDSPERLTEEYDACAASLRALKREGKA